MEIDHSPFSRALHFKKNLLRYKLIPFLTLSEIHSLLSLNKVSNQLMKEHFIEGERSFDNIYNAIKSKWCITREDFDEHFT